MSILQKIQRELNAPKDLYNKFGDYNYRSMESINEALKPLLADLGASLILSDEMVAVGDRVYVKATATLYDSEMKVIATNTAWAREAESKKGMDTAQITGATSSYARKYAANGLFLIDDTKDPDATNKHGKEEFEKNQKKHDDSKPQNAAYWIALMDKECATTAELAAWWTANNAGINKLKKAELNKLIAKKDEYKKMFLEMESNKTGEDAPTFWGDTDE